MINKEDFYIIFFTNDLTYLTDEGYSSQFIYEASRFYSLKEAKQELESLDDDCKGNTKIYRVTETKTYNF